MNNEINEIRRLAGLPPLEEARKIVKPVEMYHGTTSNVLPFIMKHGLQPNPPKKVWDAGYLESFGGVYLTASRSAAKNNARNAADKLGGDPIVIEVQVTLPSAKMDEDEVIGAMQYALRTELKFIDPYAAKHTEKFRKKAINSILNVFQQEIGSRLVGKVKKAVMEFIEMILDTINADLEEHYFFSLVDWYDRHPGYQKKFRELIDIMSNVRVFKNQGDSRNRSLRINRPIKFKGRTRITRIYMIPNMGNLVEIYPKRRNEYND